MAQAQRFSLPALDIDAKIDLAARRRDEVVGDGGKIAGDEREEIGGLGEGVVPHGEVAPVIEIAALHRIAVGQQDRETLLWGLDADAVARHHIGPVEEVGDAAEALGLALRAVDAVRHVETRQRGIGLRIAGGLDLEKEGLLAERWRW